MSLTIGELIAVVDVNANPADHGISQVEASLHGLQADMEVTARRVRAGLEEVLSELPPVEITADSTDADREAHALRQRLSVLRDVRIGIDMPIDEAQQHIAEVRARLVRLSESHPNVTVQAETRAAVIALDSTFVAAEALGHIAPEVWVHANVVGAAQDLAAVEAAAHHIDHLDPTIQVHADDREVGTLSRALSGLWGMLSGLASGGVGALGSLASSLALVGAAVPLIAGLVGTLANIAPAAAIGATAVLGLAQAVAVIKIGGAGVGGALSAAFNKTASSAGGAAAGASKVAKATDAVAKATEQAAYANEQAARGVSDAERSLADAQQAALKAQKAVNGARQQAARDLRDMSDSLIDARQAEADDVNAVEDAQTALNKAKAAGSGASQEEIDRAQLAYDEAVQQLAEQREQVRRLAEDKAAADKAGINGSAGVVAAQQNVADKQRDVADQTRAVKDAQEQMARTAKQGLDSIKQAQDSLNAAMGGGSGGAGAVDAFAAAMAKLAPSARDFVHAVIALKPAWDSLQLDVQQHLFAGLGSTLTSTAKSVLPVLRKGLVDTADDLNLMGKGVLDAAKNLATDGILGKAMSGASKGLHNLAGIPGLVVTAFGQFAAAGAPQFDKLTKHLGDGAQKLSDKISKAFSSGGMGRAIDLAVTIIGEIGDVIGNVGKIIKSVFTAAGTAGGGWLGVLKDITGAMADAFASPEVQSGLKALFGTMQVLGKTVAPLVADALKQIAPILTVLGPPVQRLIGALGDALGPVIDALGPVLLAAAGAVGSLLDAVSPLLPVIGKLIAKLVPVLTPVLKTLSTIFKKLAGPISDLAVALGDALTPILSGLGDAVSEIISQSLPIFMNLINQLIPLIPILTPVLIQLGESISEILIAVAPLLPQLTMMGIMLLTQLLPAVLPLIPPLAQLADAIIRLATYAIVKIAIPLISGFINFMKGIFSKLQPAIDGVQKVTKAIAGAFEWLYDHLVGHSVIPDLVNAIVAWFTGLPGKAARALASLPGAISDIAWNAAARMTRAVSAGVSGAVTLVQSLPGLAGDALSGIGGTLWDAGQHLVKGLIDGINSMIPSLSGTLGWITDHLPDWKGPARRDATILTPAGRSVIGGFMAGIAAQTPALQRQLGDLTGALPGSMPGGGLGLAAGGGGAAGGRGVPTLRIELAGPAEVRRLIRAIVKNDGGGDVQLAFGR